MNTRYLPLIIIAVTTLGCASSGTYQSPDVATDSSQTQYLEPIFSVFLIGDTGEASLDPREPTLKTLKTQLDKSGEQSAVIFLGDNIYPSGLPAKEARSRKRAERRLMAQLNTLDDYSGRIIFMPGNHDWHSSKRKGLQRIRRQERFIENKLQKGNTFLPDSGHPGPVSVSLNASVEDSAMDFNIQLVVLDTQWWLHPHEKPFSPGITNEKQQQEKILSDVKEIVQRHNNDEILVASHHPMISFGRHGGKFPLQTHFLPPVLGSMYVAYRNIWGYHQDIANYGDLKEGLMKNFEGKEDLIYASGHEHSLQFIPRQSENSTQYYLVSGSASRTSYVKKQPDNAFTSRKKGFISIRYYSDRSKSIEIWNENGDIIFQRYLNTSK